MTNEPEPNPRAGEALKPCPFCGGEAVVEQQGTARCSHIIACTDCGARLETGEVWNAGSSWNTRPLPQPSELVETPEAFNKKKERCLAYVEQHWKWGNLTRLGIVNQLVRDGFRQTWAIEQADRIAPAANQAVAHITQLEAQIAKLQARLEVVPGWSEDADGIACRNDTIKLQDECIAKLQADGDKLAGALERSRQGWSNVLELGLLPVQHQSTALGLQEAATQALTEWKDRA